MSADVAAKLAALEKRGSALSDVTRLVSELEDATSVDGATTFGLSGNVTIDLLATYLRKHAVLHSQRADVQVGEFGDHLGNARRFAADGVDALIMLDLFDAIQPALEARIYEIGPDRLRAQAERFGAELALAFDEARGIKDVFIGGIHRLSPPTPGASDVLDQAIGIFEEVIRDEARRFKNVHFISTSAISAELGRAQAHDLRSYERFRAPFTPAFLDEFASEVYNATRGFGSYFYKALVLDCDGTLWGGILGEDLPGGLMLGPFGYPGSMYWRMQHEFLNLQRQGVLLCLCSKNDAADVDQVLASHPDMVLRDEHFIAKRVNWEDKVDNLESLASDLNIGLDSMIFVDDSPFECDAVQGRLPMVKTMQVPADLSKYPVLINRLKRLFAAELSSGDAESKTAQYKARELSLRDRGRYATKEEYLASLGLKVTIQRNDRSSVSRIAELTQKSNQFNLTTRRYTTAQVDELMSATGVDVYSIRVGDKFGDAGLTGVAITRSEGLGTIRIDSFLLSCRVLGRGVESSVWAHVLLDAVDAGQQWVVAAYFPTSKNGQVRDYWDRHGLDLVSEDDNGGRTYRSELRSLRHPLPPSHVEVIRDF